MQICIWLCVVVLFGAAPLFGQPASPTSASSQSGSRAPSPVQLRQAGPDRATLRARAAQLKRAAELRSGTQEAREASIEEALTLAKLAGDGDVAEKRRRHRLVAELVRDEAIPRAKRFELSATSANVDVFTDKTLSRDQRMTRLAAVAWQLTRDFPENPEGFESLVRLARDSDAALAQNIATQLLASSASERVKSDARAVLNRLDLIGKSLASLVPAEFDQAQRKNRAICIYTWTAREPRTLELAKVLRTMVPPDALLVGVCLDKDIEAGRQAAAAKPVDAELIFDGAGQRSLLCEKLCLDRVGQVYVTGSGGRIKTVAGLGSLVKERTQKEGAKR